jgi:zinc/manganese transport system substrate-binding protein
MKLKIVGAISTLSLSLAGPILVPVSQAAPLRAQGDSATIIAVGAENEYADVISQIGGAYVKASSLLNNPNTDPHTFEASPSIAKTINAAKLIVQNGVGYDGFMDSLEKANPDSQRKIINVQHLLGLSDNTPNPHLWYDPKTMPKVASAIANALIALDPAHKAYFTKNLAAFNSSLTPWLNEIAKFKSKYSGVGVAVTEPVADYLLQALGLKILTPFSFQLDIMSGTDPSPELVAQQNAFFTKHLIKVFAYNQQVISPTTTSILTLAKKTNIPVVGVYETMPTPGYNYQSWMLAETHALELALSSGTSTQKL